MLVPYLSKRRTSLCPVCDTELEKYGDYSHICPRCEWTDNYEEDEEEALEREEIRLYEEKQLSLQEDDGPKYWNPIIKRRKVP